VLRQAFKLINLFCYCTYFLHCSLFSSYCFELCTPHDVRRL